MNFIRLRQLAGLGFIIFLIALNLSLFYGLFLPNARPNPERMADVPGTLWSYFTSAEKLAWLWNDLLFGRGLQGSSIWVKYLLVPVFLGPLGFAVQEILRQKFKVEGRILYTTWPYVIFMSAFSLFTATVNGIAQAENWYWNEAYKVPGTFDAATHALIGGVFAGWFLTLAWSSWFGVDKLTNYVAIRWAYDNPYWFRSRVGVWTARNLSAICEAFDEFISFALTMAISLYFEYVEFINPDRFWNLVGNSYSDIAMAAIVGTFALSYVYDKLVSDAIREYRM